MLRIGAGVRIEDSSVKTLLQIFGVLCMSLIIGTILHKGYADISALAQQHAGAKFWLELGRYFLRNLAGGAAPGS
jgi:hypothetical protein